MAVDGQVAEKSGDLFFAHFGGMSLLMKQNETANPIKVRFLGANGVALDAQMPTDAIEQARR